MFEESSDTALELCVSVASDERRRFIEGLLVEIGDSDMEVV